MRAVSNDNITRNMAVDSRDKSSAQKSLLPRTTQMFPTIQRLDEIQQQTSALPALSTTELRSLFVKENELPPWPDGANEPLITRINDEFGSYKSLTNPFVEVISRIQLHDNDHRNYLSEKWCLNRALARSTKDTFEAFNGKCDNLIPGTCSRGDVSKITQVPNKRAEFACRRFFELCRVDALVESSSQNIGIGSVDVKNIIQQNIDQLFDVPSVTNELKLPKWDNLPIAFEEYVKLTTQLRDSLISCVAGGLFCELLVCFLYLVC